MLDQILLFDRTDTVLHTQRVLRVCGSVSEPFVLICVMRLPQVYFYLVSAGGN